MLMSVNGTGTLHSFLNQDGRELMNVKFFPGTARGLTLEQVESAARASIERALESGVDSPPIIPVRSEKHLKDT
jgi:cytosine/adenosine deaminase-related metal-dependent hydrolase